MSLLDVLPLVARHLLNIRLQPLAYTCKRAWAEVRRLVRDRRLAYLRYSHARIDLQTYQEICRGLYSNVSISWWDVVYDLQTDRAKFVGQSLDELLR